jgi:hypothetical protein
MRARRAPGPRRPCGLAHPPAAWPTHPPHWPPHPRLGPPTRGMAHPPAAWPTHPRLVVPHRPTLTPQASIEATSEWPSEMLDTRRWRAGPPTGGRTVDRTNLDRRPSSAGSAPAASRDAGHPTCGPSRWAVLVGCQMGSPMRGNFGGLSVWRLMPI